MYFVKIRENQLQTNSYIKICEQSAQLIGSYSPDRFKSKRIIKYQIIDILHT